MYLSYEEVESFVSVLFALSLTGAKKIQDKGDYISFSSPFRDDRNPSMVLYKSNLFCIDFSGAFRGHLYKFYKEATGRDFLIDFQIQKGERYNRLYGADQRVLGESERVLTPSDYQMKIFGSGLSFEILEVPGIKEYLDKRFISEDFIKTFYLSYSESSKIIRVRRGTSLDDSSISQMATRFYKRLCIPIYLDDYLISIEGRNLTGETPKVLYPKGGSVSTLFNYNNLKKDEPLIVVEGIMDMPRIWEHITTNVTTTFGISVTSHQQKQLREFSDIILFPDSDDAGRRMIEGFDSFYDRPYRIASLPEGLDPGDPSVSLELLKTTIEYSKEDTLYFLDESKLFERESEISEATFWSN